MAAKVEIEIMREPRLLKGTKQRFLDQQSIHTYK
jgi:hypothetical protein